ncbi:lipopolysaccharide transport periplasmic protein LptA [Candidatus Erwinia haradaeae]|nr:lipopolysaccharide transport periplasmic protein LptA [Candidatus Erwinia haradaeae]
MIKLFIGSIFLFYSIPVLSLTEDSKHPINIYSNNQSIDILKNIATATGTVLVTHGSIKLIADKVIVIRSGNNNKKIIIDAYGNLTTFYQMQDNGKPIRGHAKNIHYELNTNKIELKGSAYIEQFNSNLKCDHLIYLIKENKIEAISNSGNHVTSTILPSQLK